MGEGFRADIMARPGVLVIHNRYLEPGGEDSVVNAEIDLLRSNGHRVLQYARHNREIAHFSNARKALLPFTTTWDYESYWRAARAHPPGAAGDCALPQSAAPAQPGCLLRVRGGGHTRGADRAQLPAGLSRRKLLSRCERLATPATAAWSKAAMRGCYHDSRRQTSVVALMLGTHRALGTWKTKVARYIAPSEFCRTMLIQHGLPANKIVVKPHFAPEILPQKKRAWETTPSSSGGSARRKGILQLLDVWRESATHSVAWSSAPGRWSRLPENWFGSRALPNVSFAGQLAAR